MHLSNQKGKPMFYGKGYDHYLPPLLFLLLKSWEQVRQPILAVDPKIWWKCRSVQLLAQIVMKPAWAFLDHQITYNYLTNHQAQASGCSEVRSVHQSGSFPDQPIKRPFL